MTETHHAYAMEYVPTFREKWMRRLGFRHPHVERPEITPEWPDFLVSTTRINFDLADRLRILFAGRLNFETVVRLPRVIGPHEVSVDFGSPPVR